jgi:hypothetical protein
MGNEMRLAMIVTVALAEIRSNRRLVRYWLYAAAAVAIGLLTFAQFTFMHGTYSGMSATVGMVGPRYLIAQTGFNLILVFLVGITFLAFDVNARDVRDRMREVLDSRPLSNAEYLFGKVAGLVFIAWLPPVIVAILFELIGVISGILELPVGDAVEPYSLLGFLVQTLSALFLWCSLIVLLTVVVRYRILVAVISLALIAGQLWSAFNVPLYIQQWISLLPTFGIASDIVPRMIAEGDTIRVLAHAVLGVGLLCLATALSPRRDGHSATATIMLGAAILVSSVSLIGFNVWLSNSRMAQDTEWRTAHQAAQHRPRADLRSMSGSIAVVPGSSISMDLDLEVVTPPHGPSSSLLFTLNPGLSISGIAAGDEALVFDHRNGLLEVELPAPIAAGTPITLNLRASGRPDTSFGYVDANLNRLERVFIQAQISILGVKPSVFESSYVAMPPGAHWLPSTGTDSPASDPRTHPYDYFMLDLQVVVPHDWLIAGPGRRKLLSSDDEVSEYRFAPATPVPHVGLLASQFIRRSTEIAGIEFELLLYPDHDRNLHFFADAQEAIKQRINALLTSARSQGLSYPYDGFSLVEIPNELRVYGGGWRLDTAQSMPGVMMLRESSLPTSRFESRFANPKDFEDREGGIGRAKLDALTQYFENDFNGGNVFTGISRNFMQFQTSAVGEGAHAINFLLDELTSRLLTEKTGYFSAYEFDNSINTILGQIIQNLAQGRFDEVAESLRRVTTNKPSVWDRALGAPLADLSLTDKPRNALNVLSLKTDAIAQSILDGAGHSRTARLLGELVTQFRGGHFTEADLNATAVSVGINLPGLLGDWLHDAALPGFLFSKVEVVRLSDDEQRNPRYQTRVHLRNDEDTPGLIKLRYQWGSDDEPVWDNTVPMHIEANSSIEVGIVTATPLFQLWTQPYLALNRFDHRLSLPRVDSTTQVDELPFSGFRQSSWQVEDSGDVIVDDLDPGFRVTSDLPVDVAQFSGFDIDLDQGLPEYQLMFGNVTYWSRAVYSDSWGKYRRTHTLIHPGEGRRTAELTASLPSAGRWRLSFYLGINPAGANQSQTSPGVLRKTLLGQYEMALVSVNDRRELEFDGKQATAGWNDLGDFDLPAGEVKLEIANVTSGIVVIVDAIRWHQVKAG